MDHGGTPLVVGRGSKMFGTGCIDAREALHNTEDTKRY